MNLNQITANIRLRSAWEAVDLGFVMVQQWWKSIYLPLAILTFGISLPLFYLLPSDGYFFASLIFWWLKPLYDRLVLHIISHKLFNEELSSFEALKALPSLIWNTGLFQTLTFRRLSLSRGFNLAIWQLEQLRGSARSERQGVLHMIAHSTAVWLTIGLWLIEIILMLSLFMLILMFMPSDMSSNFLESVFSNNLEYEKWIDKLGYLFYVLVVTLVHPFYVAGSFALYINRRTQLEAWDIELDFRKMNHRFESINKGFKPAKKTITSSVFILISAFILINNLGTSTVSAEEAPEILANERKSVDQSREIIDEVMLTKNLNDKRKVKKWVKKKTKAKKKKKSSVNMGWFESFSRMLAVLLEALLWIAIATGIFLIYYFRNSWLHLFKTKKHDEDKYIAPEVMFGMDVRPDSLPDDIISESRNLWQQGEHRQALSLLYSGALVRLINQEKVELHDSHTEGDVIKHTVAKLTQSNAAKTKQSYLRLLTSQWQTIAYAHRTPDENSMQLLFNTWESDFAIQLDNTAPSAVTDNNVENHNG